MNAHLRFVALGIAALVMAGCATLDRPQGGGTVLVEFERPDQFTDMLRRYPPARGADAEYMRDLQTHIERVGAGRLPAGYTLAITITDVDMAGDFEPQHGPGNSDIRLIRRIYPPRIDLSYRLIDPNGAVRTEGQRQLRDPAFDWRTTTTDRQDPLRHEKALVDDFLRDVTRGL